MVIKLQVKTEISASAKQKQLFEQNKDKVTAKLELITPEYAKKVLEKRNENNFRPLSTKSVARYVSDMEKGLWTLSECIHFDENGNLINGQHRLQAVIDFGHPVAFMVARNMPEESARAFDIGKVRTTNQVVAHEILKGRTDKNIFSEDNLAAFTALTKSIYTGPLYQKHRDITSSAVPAMIEKYKDALSFCNEIFFANKVRGEDFKGIHRAPFLCVFARAYICNKNNPEALSKIRMFGSYFRNPSEATNCLEVDTIKALCAIRDNIRELKGGGAWMSDECYYPTMKALHSFINDEPIKRFKKTENMKDEFEIEA